MRTLIVGKASPSCPPRHDSSVPTAFAASRTSTSRPSWRCASAWPRRTSSVTTPAAPVAAPRPSSAATPAPRASSSPPPSIAGLASAGVDVYHADVLPTPAIAFLTADTHADFGVMLSASHNAMPDNGIKFFAAGGHKLDDADRGRDRGPASTSDWERPTGADVGRVVTMPDGHTRYISHLLDRAAQPARRHQGRHRRRPRRGQLGLARGVPAGRRRGLRDRHRARRPQHQRRLRLDPPRPPQGRRGRAAGADLGIAHDGDADRCLAVDASGTEVDGDQIMAHPRRAP